MNMTNFEFKGTPGPWLMKKSDILYLQWDVKSADGPIAQVYGGDDEGKRNACLIAAAPEMFELLNKCVGSFNLVDFKFNDVSFNDGSMLEKCKELLGRIASND